MAARHRTKDIIGTTETIDFPDLGLFAIPTKIDTGADSSAIWATNIQITPEGLSFTLFGPGRRYYTGKPIVVQVYRTASVKNSFGTVEFRYKVRLLLRVGDRKIHGWFTLSDRAGMQYPILLGRRLLKNKFVVDVSQAKLQSNQARPKRVLVIASQQKNLQQFVSEVAGHMSTEVEVVARGYQQLAFWIEPGHVVVRETLTNQDIADFDFVYFKSHKRYYSFAVACAQYLAFKHVPFIDQELLTHVSYDKLSETMRLAIHGVAVPRTFCAAAGQLKRHFAGVLTQWGAPLVCKEIASNRGHNNYLIENATQLDKILANANDTDHFMVQAYIPNQGYLRAYVFGKNVSMVVQRTPVPHHNPRKRHLNNPRGGENAHIVPASNVPSAVFDAAVRATKLMERQVAGVDIIQNAHSKEWVVLEVNAAPQLRDGSYTKEKRAALAKFIDIELKR
ncbi:MAG TPA: RimK/LysX family protein [Nevskiaceae bacterium]|nr:RimK/LysX family protein [Nevskiaceae bacterium]